MAKSDEILSGQIPGYASGIEILQQITPYVRHCGNQRRDVWEMETRRLLDYLLVFIADGTGRFEIAGKSYDVTPGDLYWIPPDTPHFMQGFAPGMICPYVHFDLIYRPSVSHWDFTIPGGMCDLSELKPLMHPPLPHGLLRNLVGQIRTATNKRVGGLINDICDEALHAQPFAFLRMSGLLTIIVAEILRGLQGLGDYHSRHIPALEKAADFLTKNSHKDISVEQAAEIAQLSESYFRTLFTTYYACCPRKYLRRTRINNSKLLMVQGTMNISQIAKKVGFATIHSFTRAFKGEEGITPTQYSKCGRGATYTPARKSPYSR